MLQFLTIFSLVILAQSSPVFFDDEHILNETTTNNSITSSLHPIQLQVFPLEVSLHKIDDVLANYTSPPENPENTTVEYLTTIIDLIETTPNYAPEVMTTTLPTTTTEILNTTASNQTNTIVSITIESNTTIEYNQSAPGFGNNRNFSETTTAASPVGIVTGIVTGIITGIEEALPVTHNISEVPLIDWKYKQQVSKNATTPSNHSNHVLDEEKIKNLKTLAQLLNRNSLNGLIHQIRMTERYRKVSLILKDTLSKLLHTLFDEKLVIGKSKAVEVDPGRQLYERVRPILNKAKNTLKVLFDEEEDDSDDDDDDDDKK